MIDPSDVTQFRKILGHYPTGVCAVTARSGTGDLLAMIVGSFTSVSLSPPLVAFFPDKSSTSWPKIRGCGGFCVNVLADSQLELCARLGSKDSAKFDGVGYHLSSRGSPILDGAVAWLDCSVDAIHEAGDHYVVLGEVLSLDLHHLGEPLLFHKGTYGKIATLA